jgi:hypothetical protein
MSDDGQSELKGLWFAIARRTLLAEYGEATLNGVLARIPEAHRHALEDPVISAWYPEISFQQCLAAVESEVTPGQLQFERFIEQCTERGVNLLFSILLRLSTPGFVLKRVPTMWRQLRRGAGQVVVETDQAVTTLHYTGFPFFDDERYRWLTIGSLRSLVRTCIGEAPHLEVIYQTRDSLGVRISGGAAR